MSQALKKRIEKICLERQKLKGEDGQRVEINKIVYFAAESGKVIAYLDYGTGELQQINVKYSVNELEKLLSGIFIRTHREYLLRIKRICGVSRRYYQPDEEEPIEDRRKILRPYEMSLSVKKSVLNEGLVSLKGVDVKFPLTNTYSSKLKKLFGLKHLHYLVPEHPEDKRMRLNGLIDFGWRELYDLDAKDERAILEFKKKWSIKDFSEERLRAHFRRIGSDEIDIRRMTQNFLWQLYRWIKKGIEKPVNGNIRTLWYRIKPLIGKVADLLDEKNVDVFYDALHEMIDQQQLFCYKDFGLTDINSDVREIGKKRPEVVIAVEKEGIKGVARKMARKVGCTHICLKGEPAMISMEYFTDELKGVLKPGQKVDIFMYVDLDPSGASIKNNFISGLKQHGIKINKVIDLVTLDLYSDEDIAYDRYPIGRYEIVNGKKKAVKPANMSSLTKILNWYENDVNSDARLFEEVVIAGRKYYTIHGLESDSASQVDVWERLAKEVGV